MGILRIYPEKSNTIASNVYQYYNSSQNAVSDLWYGGGNQDSAIDRRNSISRFITKFDLVNFQSELNQKGINQDLITSIKLKMTNTIPRDRVLEKEYEYDKLNKQIASSFDMITFPIPQDWDDGRGYDLVNEHYVAQQKGSARMTGYSNWVYAKQGTSWTEPGIYGNPLSYYTGNTEYSGVTFVQESGYTDTAYSFNILPIEGTVDSYYVVVNNNSFTYGATNLTASQSINFYVRTDVTGVTLNDFVSTLTADTIFQQLQLTVSSGNSSYITVGDSFTLDSSIAVSRNLTYIEQHFAIGDEDVEMDVTDIVFDWLSGGSSNNGLCLAFHPDYERTLTNDRYISSFFTDKTNTAYKPYLEISYNQYIKDDRHQVSAYRPSRLFLYTFSGNNAVNAYTAASAMTVDVKIGSTNVYTGLTPTHMEKGVYYIDVWMSGATPGQQYTDTWNNVKFNPPYDDNRPAISQTFQVQKDYYDQTPDINEYALSIYGIENNTILRNIEQIRIYCNLRVNYSLKPPSTQYILKYSIVMNNQIEVVPWTSVNQIILNNCQSNYFLLDTSWLLHNQTYEILFKIEEMGTSRIMPEKIGFKVLRDF